jgi:hypothetical protein
MTIRFFGTESVEDSKTPGKKSLAKPATVKRP